MTTWFTSDHHFGHANIIKYQSRPFGSTDEMNKSMQEAWNRVVHPDDTVYYIGDFAIKPALVANLLPRLNGQKILIAGNHDRCHQKLGKPDKWLKYYMDSGFSSIHTEIVLEIAGEEVLLHHFPYRVNTQPMQKYTMQRPLDKGGWLIHGHVHGLWKISGKQINVSVENWNYEPVSLDTIKKIIQEGSTPMVAPL
jgi:calcineurin-like phosphoesterase family protein